MFTYFHCYMPETWDAQLKAGFIDKTSGIRFAQSLMLSEGRKFNNLAKRDGILWNIIKENKYSLYIDRLQGGCYYEGYDFNMTLVEDYKNLLGHKFMGFQMHEWLSNYRSDLKKLGDAACEDWSEQGIKDAIFRSFPYPHLFLEAHSAREMAENGRPEGWQTFFCHGEKLFKKRQDYTGGMLLPCDSAYMAPKLEISLGARALMPEVGAQIRDTRVQLAYTRGMARAAKIPFGVYYEPWGGRPFSACCYHSEGKNEWGIGTNTDFPFETMGENGGSSRSLQRRIHLYSYLSGAEFISEEWGMCNTFYDWNDFELTPYGRVKLEFLDFCKKIPFVGRHFTPIAIVLPRDLQVLENIHEKKDLHFDYPVEKEKAKSLRLVREGICSLLSLASDMEGDETKIMINSPIPDAFDIVHEDCTDALKNYEYLVDLSGSSDFSKKHRNICSVQEAPELLKSLMPCSVRGAVHWFVNRIEGAWLLVIFNHSGVERSVEKGERYLFDCAETVKVSVKSGAELKKLAGDGKLRAEQGEYSVDLPAGGWVLAAFGDM